MIVALISSVIYIKTFITIISTAIQNSIIHLTQQILLVLSF